MINIRRGGHEVAFYRSPITRWTYVIAGLIGAWGLSPIGPHELREAPAIVWLHQVVPHPVMTGSFLLYALLAAVAVRPCFLIACLLGMFLYAAYAAALLVTVVEGFPGSAVAFAALASVVAQHYASVRLALFDERSP